MTTKQEFNCIFCQDVFNSKEDLQEHFRKHGDPKFKNRSEIDSKATDEKSKEKSEMVGCDVCSQVFPTISKAITHKHKVHPDHDAKYFCPWCGKLFTMKHLYNVHVKSNHNNQDITEDRRFQCDGCSVVFYAPSAMIYHNKFFHRQDTDLPDVGQSKKIKFYNQEIIQIYYCAFCGEEYENKVNLIKHMSDDHGDENQTPDEVLKCPMCDAVFYHLDAYEVHLTFHSSEDMYSVKNSEFTDLLDYSLETVPPIIEKVETLDMEDRNQDTDAESTINAVGIEKFLELAMDQSDDSNPVKVKKHKKHKKSKKSAITLDEFLSMNQDVFGEGLDFQGIEEVPTRVVKKHLKTNKKINNAAPSAELDKLKKAGIVVKRKVNRNPIVKGLQVTASMPIKSPQKMINKINPKREIETSSEVLTKLMNQSNNQIKIVKKTNNNSATDVSKPSPPDVSVEKCEKSEENISKKIEELNPDVHETESDHIPKLDLPDSTKNLPSPKTGASRAAAITDNFLPNKVCESKNSDGDKEITKNMSNENENLEKVSEVPDVNNVPKLVHKNISEGVTNEDHDELEMNEPDLFNSDEEFVDTENHSETENCIKTNKSNKETPISSDNHSKHENTVTTPVSSLSTLKHLSHLITVKPVMQNKKTVETDITNDNSQSLEKDIKKEIPNLLPDKASPSNSNTPAEKDLTMDALKTLSKNITIKSLATKRNINESLSEDSNNDAKEKTNNISLQDVSSNKNITIKKIKVEQIESKLDNKVINTLHSQEKKCQPKVSPIAKNCNKITVEKPDNIPQTNSHANILKRLPNITTKPILNRNIGPPSAVKQANIPKKIVQTEEKNEEIIEIFDIDSEDEDDNKYNNKPPEPTQKSSKSMDALKNLGKNITVKSFNQQSSLQNIKIENKIIKKEKEENCSQSSFKEESNADTPTVLQNRNAAYKNVLQGLGKNITIKSRNSSPSQIHKSQEYNLQDFKVPEETSSDSDSYSENVKITELNHENEEDNLETDNFNTNFNDPIIESPHDSCSDNEDINDEIHDFETDIKVSTVQKSNQHNINSTINSVYLNNLKNTNKNITIKSLSKKPTDNEENAKPSLAHESLETSHIQKKQMIMKTPVQGTKEIKSENTSTNRISNNFDEFDNSSTQPLSNKLSASNQVNTINKEVTVKTFQTKTVIQEITTTVTKTIKTVNQTMKQEVRNTFQANSPMVTQRVQGIRPNQSINLQGVVIRHAPPVSGVRASNVVSQIRPAGTGVRPTKQIVPIRAGMNVVRHNNPRMAIGKKIVPSPSPNKQVIGKPLKIAPSAMCSTIVKRPNTEDVTGPFSCFKKPKESLIPVSDIPTFSNSGGEATAQFTAASHTSSSNFTSSTKTIRGNSVVTAKQIKSEVNSTSQQISRFSNTTGVKVMTSQQQQSQVHEKSETSAMKRTTLEAIQRLQKQGLLVKKPRVDVNEDSDHSNPDGDNNTACNISPK